MIKGLPCNIEPGNPFECVVLERDAVDHTYVFLVRMVRIGSERGAPLRLETEGVEENHVQILLSAGKYLAVAPRASAPVLLDEVELEPGVPTPLAINTEIWLGDTRLMFRETTEADFNPS